MDSAVNSQDDAGQRFGAGPGPLQLPAQFLEKIQQVRRLLGEINRDLGLPPLGPGGDPVIPPGAIPGMVIPRDEIERIRDSIFGGIFGGILAIEPGILIAGVELTQSIQFFNLDKQSSGAGADNSVPLVANKELVLRVYVETRTLLAGYIPALVTGRVRIGGQEFQPLNGPIQPLAAGLIRRANLNHTLNFRIPAALCRGTRTILVRVFDSAAANPLFGIGIHADGSPMRFSSTSETFAATFRDVPPMRVMGVMVHFTGNGLDLPAPPGTNLADTLARFLPMFPTHGFDFGPCVLMDFGGDLRVGGGWDNLLNTIADLRSASTQRAIFVGLLPANIMGQVGGAQRGIGRPGIAIASRDDTRALSHEFGHATLIEHIDAGGAPAPFDTNYPKYGTFPFGSIGEFGLNTARMTLFSPATTQDLMTYSDNPDVLFPPATWISPYHYERMMNALVTSDGTGDYPVIISWTVTLMLLNFRLHRDGRVELLPSYQVTGVTSRDTSRPYRSVMLDLIGRNDEVIGSYRCHVHNPYQDPGGAYVDFHEVLPWSEDVARVVFVRRGKVLQTIDADERQPEIRLRELHRVKRDGDLARVEWTVEDSSGPHHAMVRYSNDDGRTWQAVAAALTETRYLANLETLPGGEQCRFQVIVSSGLRSAVARTEPFAVPRKARKAHLFSPREGDIFGTGQPVSFMGGGHSPEGGTCAPDEVMWRSSLEGTLGTGYQMVRGDLRTGSHRITLSLPDDAGGEAAASVWIKIVEGGDVPADCSDRGGHQTLG